MRYAPLMAILLLAAGCATAPPPPTDTRAGPAAVSSAKLSSEAGLPPPPPTRHSEPPGLPNHQAAASAPRAGTAAPVTGIPILQTPRFENLMDRITAGFAMPELNLALVQQHERWITRNPEYLNRVFERGGKYLHHIVEELEARNMPTELALLPIVESAFNPQALSKAKAAGLWQFIPSTGRIYELEQNWWMDQRRDVIESTRAALDYLQRLYDMQDNDWFLALASYNWGEGAVLRARKRNQAAGKPTDYASLKMPKETQNYVPKLIALRNVLSRPKEFGITLPTIPNKPFFVVIDKEQSIDLALAARFAGMSIAEFTELNPSQNRPVISVSRTDRIILPTERAEGFQRQLQEHLARGEPLVTWKPYTLKPNETLASLAKRTGVTAAELIQANSLKRNAQPLPGTVLLAPFTAQSDEASIETTLARFTGSRIVEKETLGPVYHRVTTKDTLAKIARRYGVSAGDIRAANKLEDEPQPGQRLLIRPARTQTVLTDEQGRRSVIAARESESPAAPVATQKTAQKTAEKSAQKTAQKAPQKPAQKSAKESQGEKKNPAKKPDSSDQAKGPR